VKPKVYQYPIAKDRVDYDTRVLNRLPNVAEAEEEFTGIIQGLPAKSREEERFARALENNNLNYVFEFEVPTADDLPGEQRSIDFLVDREGVQVPVEIKGAIGHGFEEDEAADLVREAILTEALGKMGIYHDIVSVFDYEIPTPEMANAKILELT